MSSWTQLVKLTCDDVRAIFDDDDDDLLPIRLQREV